MMGLSDIKQQVVCVLPIDISREVPTTLKHCEVKTDVRTERSLPFKVLVSDTHWDGTNTFYIVKSCQTGVHSQCLIWLKGDVTKVTDTCTEF